MATILVVDDEPLNRLLVATVLASAGHAVLEAATAAEALRKAAEHRPKLIIVDLSLPDMNGTQLIRALRADSQLSQCSLALYTASTMSGALADFLDLMQIRVVIPKPSEPEEILRLAQAALH